MNRIIPKSGAFIDRIRINRMTREEREGRPVWVKRRLLASRLLIPMANGFFGIVQNPVTVLPTSPEWQRREVDSFRLLNGDGFAAGAFRDDMVWAHEIPGTSLCKLLDLRQLTAAMMAAAGRELRRAHGMDGLDGAWSHGDPHLGNFIFEPGTARCRMIDFEVVHDPALSADARHVDDLLVPLLDLCGRVEPEHWPEFAAAYIEAYDRPSLVPELIARLHVPQGAARWWWAIRSGYVSDTQLKARMASLRERLRILGGVPAAQ